MGQGFPNQRIGVNVSVGGALAQSGTVVLSNSNNVSFGVGTSASSMVITLSVAQLGGISAGTALASTGTISFSNANGISFGLNGQTLTASLVRISRFEPGDDMVAPNALVAASTTLNLSFQRVTVPLAISATRIEMLMNLTVVASTAGSYTLSFGIYTMSGSTANLASSGSRSQAWVSSEYNSYSGTRWRSASLAWNVTPGDYLLGVMGSINGPAGTTGSMSIYGGSAISVSPREGLTATSIGNNPFYFADGLYSAATGAFPASLHATTAILQTGALVLAQPYFMLFGTY